MSTTGGCLFCSIVAGDIPAQIFYEDEGAVAFLDIRPIALAHTLVVPRIHAETLLDLPEDGVAPLFLSVRRVLAILTKAIAPAGFTIGVNQGAGAGQAVPHLHIHLIPRFPGDGGGSLHSVVHRPPSEPLEELCARLRAGAHS